MQSAKDITPREVANKSSKDALRKAIGMSLGLESPAVRHNTQTFNRGRYAAVQCIADYDQLKDQARAIKERSVQELPKLVSTLEAVVRARGGHFYLASTAEDATRYIREVCVAGGVRRVVKAKSMTSEEVRLNPVLESAGIEVAETDLAEFILQAADEQPSHIIAPAIHYSRERITALFQRVFRTSEPLETGEELTRFARERLRGKFLAADAGISGANLIAADSGTLMLVESEGNIRMTTLVPPLHIAIVGVEKIVASRQDFAPFVELLAASATGQPMTSYTNFICPPLAVPAIPFHGGQARPREFHLVLVDNGRLCMREDPLLRDALYCIRCSACLNSCANFQTVGGHAFGGETYSGGIGGAWEAGTTRLENARFSELCTGCSRCVPQCPVRIDIPWLNEGLRERLNHPRLASIVGAAASQPGTLVGGRAPLQKLFFGHYDKLAQWGVWLAPISNWLGALPGARLLLEKAVGFDRRRELPRFPNKTWEQCFRAEPAYASQRPPVARVVLVADVFTNYSAPDRGMAAVRVLRALNIDVILIRALPDGRAALSQGLIAVARRQAAHMAAELIRHINDGRDIVVLEPSVLAMFRWDYAHLLDDPELVAVLRDRSFEVVEYLWKVVLQQSLNPAEIFPLARSPYGTRLMYHAHCQQKTVGSASATEALLRATGFDVVTPSVECCGMAGSFGFKSNYYDLSMAVGADLSARIAEAECDGPRWLVATGISCQEQIRTLTGRPVIHPAELLDAIMVPISLNTKP
jgi:iron-sulfur cluster protein